MQEMSGGAMLAYRRFERASMRRRLEAAAAVIATGGAAAGASSSSSMQVCGLQLGRVRLAKLRDRDCFQQAKCSLPFLLVLFHPARL